MALDKGPGEIRWSFVVRGLFQPLFLVLCRTESLLRRNTLRLRDLTNMLLAHVTRFDITSGSLQWKRQQVGNLARPGC